ncbi:MAG TPA: PAS domain-containing protein [Thermoplasmata archaeon]|nr:PAS domain-containing protein [Thermoplasmata archaeon]
MSAREDDLGEFRSFFEAAPLPLFLLDGARRVRRANRVASQTFSPTGAELRGQPFPELFAPKPGLDGAFEAVRTGRTPFAALTTEGREDGGRLFPVEVLLVPLRVGEADAFGVVVRDLRIRATGPQGAPSTAKAPGAYTLSDLLMANRLRELV